jgi:hypothetical protein
LERSLSVKNAKKYKLKFLGQNSSRMTSHR